MIKIGEPAVEPLIASMAESDNWQVPMALGAIKDKRAVVPLLKKLHESGYPPMKDVVCEALGLVTGKDFAQNRDKWLKWGEEELNISPPLKAVSKLDFRIVPDKDKWPNSNEFNLDTYVGGYIWLPINEGFDNIEQYIYDEKDGQKYLLVSNWSYEVMLACNSWGLKNAYVIKDPRGKPMVIVVYDESGSEYLEKLTGDNIDKPLAICIDDKVISAPRIMTKISGRGAITGSFSMEEAEGLADKLKKGMPEMTSEELRTKSEELRNPPKAELINKKLAGARADLFAAEEKNILLSGFLNIGTSCDLFGRMLFDEGLDLSKDINRDKISLMCKPILELLPQMQAAAKGTEYEQVTNQGIKLFNLFYDALQNKNGELAGKYLLELRTLGNQHSQMFMKLIDPEETSAEPVSNNISSRASDTYIIEFKVLSSICHNSPKELLNILLEKFPQELTLHNYSAHKDGNFMIGVIHVDTEKGKDVLEDLINESDKLKLIRSKKATPQYLLKLDSNSELIKDDNRKRESAESHNDVPVYPPLNKLVTVDIDHSPKNTKLSVQYGVVAICKAAGVGYDWDISAKLADPGRRKYIPPIHIKDKNAHEAINEIITPVDLEYGIKNNKLYLYMKKK